jgi:transcription antitermination factor NusG
LTSLSQLKYPVTAETDSMPILLRTLSSSDAFNRRIVMYEDSWSVLHVIANHEKKVAQQLAGRSLEHYLPLYSERSRWTDRTVILERPLFPGYVFVRYSPETRVSLIAVPGALRLLGTERSETVQGAEIERIRTALASGYALRPHSPVLAGTQVRISRGIFEGLEGIVTDLRRNCKVIMAVAAVQQYISFETDLRDIEVLDDRTLRFGKQPLYN